MIWGISGEASVPGDYTFESMTALQKNNVQVFGKGGKALLFAHGSRTRYSSLKGYADDVLPVRG